VPPCPVIVWDGVLRTFSLGQPWISVLQNSFSRVARITGRDQENWGSKPTQANSSMRAYLEKPFTKTGLVEWLQVKALSSNPSTAKKKKNYPWERDSKSGIPAWDDSQVLEARWHPHLPKNVTF
jgi:hypothetical protein